MAIVHGILKRILLDYESSLGDDYIPYRHHAHRVAGLCAEFSRLDGRILETIAIAAAFHDLGIWTDGTFDYLEPSVRRATEYLEGSGRGDRVPEVAAMIREHHKLTPYRGDAGPLVEAFRRADWIDVTGGVRTFGLRRQVVRDLYTRWPGVGFHWRLVELQLARVRTHPFSPLPMVRL